MSRRQPVATLALTALLWLGATAIAPPARGHQLHAAISTVLFNPRTGNIEVMHRFFRHDAEHALSLIGGRSADLLDEAEDRARFAIYVHEHFGLTGVGAELEPLTLVGSELEGQYLWVYQRTPAPASIDGLAIRCDALRGLWPEQVNTVNVERGRRVRTLTFAGDATTLTVDLRDTPASGQAADRTATSTRIAGAAGLP